MPWRKLEQTGAVPGPRSSHAICCIGEDVYMFGGEIQPRVPVDDVLYKFTLSSGVWSSLPAAEGASPGPRVAATMVAVGQKIYLFGEGWHYSNSRFCCATNIFMLTVINLLPAAAPQPLPSVRQQAKA
jgi:hypothetical protein